MDPDAGTTNVPSALDVAIQGAIQDFIASLQGDGINRSDVAFGNPSPSDIIALFRPIYSVVLWFVTPGSLSNITGTSVTWNPPAIVTRPVAVTLRAIVMLFDYEGNLLCTSNFGWGWLVIPCEFGAWLTVPRMTIPSGGTGTVTMTAHHVQATDDDGVSYHWQRQRNVDQVWSDTFGAATTPNPQTGATVTLNIRSNHVVASEVAVNVRCFVKDGSGSSPTDYAADPTDYVLATGTLNVTRLAFKAPDVPDTPEDPDDPDDGDPDDPDDGDPDDNPDAPGGN